METILTPELMDRCHAGSKAKGFWDVKPHYAQQLMLISGELGEAQEAHRKNRTHRLKTEVFNAWMLLMEYEDSKAEGIALFEKYGKDTVQDELADTYIRLCDFAKGFDWPFPTMQEYADAKKEAELPYDNFGQCLMEINLCVCTAYEQACNMLNFVNAGEQLASAMIGLEILCEKQNIDLAAHIDLKLRYNSTRAYMHSKAY
jgi:NTP pyrophosphatase (non-canonical NTP hydrolase)